MFRRPVHRGRPGLLGTMARTAVVAGTATAVSGNVQRRQEAKQAAVQQEAAPMQTQQVQAAAPPPAAAAGGGTDMMAQLQQLAQMEEMSALSEQEFQAAKAKLLGM